MIPSWTRCGPDRIYAFTKSIPTAGCFSSPSQMSAIIDHMRALGALAAALLLFGLAPAIASGASPGTRSGGEGASRYPAGATRSLILPARRSAGKAARSARKPSRAPARKKPRRPVLHGNPARALAAFQSMQLRYAIEDSGLYVGEPFSYLWPFSQTLAATVSMASIPKLGVSMEAELHRRLVGLESYLDSDNADAPEGVYTSTLAAFDATVAPPAGPGGAKYYDDNDWVGIELARLYRLDHNSAVLGIAEGIMAFEMAGWQSSPELGCPGGIPFNNTAENTDRNTVTTAPTAELALQLYRITRSTPYLQFAEQAYAWVRTCLLAPSGMYADHLNRQGVVEPMLWSYNQGSMIGAGTLLYQATGNSYYLYQARQTAKAALSYFTLERLESEVPFFAAVYFRNLMYLDSITHDPPGPKLAQAYVNNAWQNLREDGNIFLTGEPATPSLLVQTAITQIYALLSSPPSTYF